MDDFVKPVVTAKPVRGREMITKVVPDIFGSLAAIKSKQDEVPSKDPKYHEGYVDDKLYLVPDKTLETMKDIINFRMRQKRSTRYKHQASFELAGYDHFNERIKNVLQKLETLDDLHEDDEFKDDEKLEDKRIESEKDLEPSSTDKETPLSDKFDEKADEFPIGDVKPSSEETKPPAEDDTPATKQSKASVPETVPDITTNRDVTSNKSSKEDTKYDTPSIKKSKVSFAEVFPNQDVTSLKSPSEHSKYDTPLVKQGDASTTDISPDKDVTSIKQSDDRLEPKIEDESKIKISEENKLCFRFLISGHINSDQVPMYIVQKYDGPKLISQQESDICSSKSDKEVNICINGRFFDKNILEESQGKPVALNTTLNRILIDENQCKIYNNNFNEVFSFDAADVHIGGEFIRNELSNNITPMLTLKVKKHLQLNN